MIATQVIISNLPQGSKLYRKAFFVPSGMESENIRQRIIKNCHRHGILSQMDCHCLLRVSSITAHLGLNEQVCTVGSTLITVYENKQLPV